MDTTTLPSAAPADRLRLRSAHGEGLARKARMAQIEAEFLLIGDTAFALTSADVKSWAINEGGEIARDMRRVIERASRFNAAIEQIVSVLPLAAPRAMESMAEAQAVTRLADYPGRPARATRLHMIEGGVRP